MSRFAIVDGSGNVASVSSNGALLIAGIATLAGTNVSTSAVEVIVRPPVSKAVGAGSGNVKASAGTLWGFIPTTGGDLEFKDGNTSIGRWSVTVAQNPLFVSLYPGIPMGTNISISASGAVATVIYT